MSPVAWTNRLAKAWRRSWQRNGTSAQRAICAPMAVPLSGTTRGLEVLVLVNLTSRRWIDTLRPFQAADVLLAHPGLGKEPDDPARHHWCIGDQLINLRGRRIGRARRQFSDVPLAELFHLADVDEVP